MNRLLPSCAIVSMLLLPSIVQGQVYYTYPSGAILDQGQVSAGPYVAAGDRFFRAAIFTRFGISRYLEAGLETLADSEDSEWLWGIGVDAKFGLFPAAADIPFDMSFNTGFGFRVGESVDSYQIPIGLLMSSPYRTDGGNSLVPYGGVYLLVIDTRVDTPAGRFSDRDLDVELRLGVRYATPRGLDVWSEVHVGRDALFQLGFILGLR